MYRHSVCNTLYEQQRSATLENAPRQYWIQVPTRVQVPTYTGYTYMTISLPNFTIYRYIIFSLSSCRRHVHISITLHMNIVHDAAYISSVPHVSTWFHEPRPSIDTIFFAANNTFPVRRIVHCAVARVPTTWKRDECDIKCRVDTSTRISNYRIYQM